MKERHCKTCGQAGHYAKTCGRGATAVTEPVDRDVKPENTSPEAVATTAATRVKACRFCRGTDHYAPTCPQRSRVASIGGETIAAAKAREDRCKPGVAEDHRAGVDASGARLWKCSGCGIVAPWSLTWMCLGSIECRRCWRQIVDAVACSEACAKKVAPHEEVLA